MRIRKYLKLDLAGVVKTFKFSICAKVMAEVTVEELRGVASQFGATTAVCSPKTDRTPCGSNGASHNHRDN
jgi:hypothetical protein